MKHDLAQNKRSAIVLGAVFVLLAAGIMIVGYGYYRNYEAHYRAQVENQLSAIADLKVTELAQYRKERLGDAAILFDNPAFAEHAAAFLDNPRDVTAHQQLETWLSKYQIYNQYDLVRLLDADGVTRLALPADGQFDATVLTARVTAALQTGQIDLVDFYWNDRGENVYLSLLIPIHGAQADRRVIGLLELRIAPHRYLYPFIQQWPTPSESAETLLIRRDGNEALYLNDLRFRPDAALTMRVPLTRTEVPAVRAALGETGIVYGQDYRGVPVVGSVRAVPDSPWFLVAKIDDAEVFAPLSARLWEMLALVGALVISAGAGVGLIWRQQRAGVYRERLAAAEIVQESERLLREAQTIAGLGSYVLDLRTGLWTSSPILDTIFGIDENYVRSIDTWSLIIHPDWRERMTAYFANDVVGQHQRFDREYPIVRVQDGVLRWVQGLGQLEFDAQGQPIKMTGTIVDITARKQAETALRESEAKHRILFMDSPDAYLIVMDGVFVDCNRATEIMLGGDRTQIIGRTPDALSPEFQPDGRSSSTAAREEIDAARQTGRNTFEWVHHRLDGTDFLVEVSIAAMSLDGQAALFITWRDITERKRAENLIRARLALMEYSATHALPEVLQNTLDQVGELTHSPIGFYHFVEADQATLSLQAWSTRTVQEFCQAQGAGAHYPVDQAGVWADSVRTKQPIIHNDYATLPNRKGLPDGHAQVVRELVVPILRGDKVVGILGIGNKSVDYTDADVELVRYFADVAWEIAERKRAEESLRETNAYLENLINYANAPIIVWDPHFLITRFNHAFEFLTGRSEAEVVGQSLEISVPARAGRALDGADSPDLDRRALGNRRDRDHSSGRIDPHRAVEFGDGVCRRRSDAGRDHCARAGHHGAQRNRGRAGARPGRRAAVQPRTGTICLRGLARSARAAAHGLQLHAIAGAALRKPARRQSQEIHSLCGGWRRAHAAAHQ